MRENNYQPRFVYPQKLSFKNEQEIKTFSDKQKLRVCYQQTLTQEKSKNYTSELKKVDIRVSIVSRENRISVDKFKYTLTI